MSKKRALHSLSYDDIVNSSERVSYEEGKLLLVNLMQAGDAAITSAKLSLKCKLKKGRIEVPVRSVHCRPHLECFGLRNYLDCEAKNSATIGAPSSKKSQRTVWACPVCRNRARAEDLRVDDYFAHNLRSMPVSVDEVQLLPDGSFEAVSSPAPEVTIDDEEPFEPQPEHCIRPSGPGPAIEELFKQSKAFQLTLQDGKSFRTKKDIHENVGLFLEKERDTLSTLFKKLTSANESQRHANGEVAANTVGASASVQPKLSVAASSTVTTSDSNPTEMQFPAGAAHASKTADVTILIMEPPVGSDADPEPASNTVTSLASNYARRTSIIDIAGQQLPIRATNPTVLHSKAMLLNCPAFAAELHETLATGGRGAPSIDETDVAELKYEASAKKLVTERKRRLFSRKKVQRRWTLLTFQKNVSLLVQPQHLTNDWAGSSLSGANSVGASPGIQPKLAAAGASSTATSGSNAAEWSFPPDIVAAGVALFGQEPSTSRGAAPAKKSRWCDTHVTIARSIARHRHSAIADRRWSAVACGHAQSLSSQNTDLPQEERE
ncbi:MIZ zinc finger family protein [Aphelenchoides avenae]|nr:MIZ zinc finger family protein [Aphelenchus avenae]